jgi:hypothetical protein
MSKRTRFSVFTVLSGSLFVALLTGCSGSFAPSEVEPNVVPIGNIQGSVHGGQAPVAGAWIYLFAAGTSGYGTAATSLLTSGGPTVSCPSSATPAPSNASTYPILSTACFTKTDGGGNFALAGDYSCTQGQEVYMVAVGGNPGASATPATTTATFSANSSTITVASATGISLGMTAAGTGVAGTVTAVSGKTITLSQQTTSAGTNASVTFSGVNNAAIIQMAALGQCPSGGNLAAQVPFLVINEVSTVAFAYSVGGFATTPFNVSTSSTGTTGLANAFANATNIVNIGSGTAPTTAIGNANSTNPQKKLYTLANILATCVNQASSNATLCQNLFNDATSSTATPATDEASAIFNIVHNQTQNVTSIYNLSPAAGVFSPTLTGAPTDWTMPVVYSGLLSQPGSTNGSITSGPFNIAFDANGNAWIGDRVKGAVEVGPQGAAHTYNSGFGMVKGVAVSPQDGTIWVSDFGSNAVRIMSSTGTVLSNLTTDMHGPIMTAFSIGNGGGVYSAYEANETTTGIILYNASTYGLTHYASTNYTNVGTPGWISVDQNGYAWIPSTNSTYVGELVVTENGKSGTYKYTSSQHNGSPSSYVTVVDSNSNIWLADISGNNQIDEIASGGTAVSATHSGGGVNGLNKMSVDGGNNIWIANANANTVSGWSQTNGNWLASAGFSTSASTSNVGCVVATPDPSGNLWTANADGSVSQLLGLAVPTAAPMYGGTLSTDGTQTKGNLGAKP